MKKKLLSLAALCAAVACAIFLAGNVKVASAADLDVHVDSDNDTVYANVGDTVALSCFVADSEGNIISDLSQYTFKWEQWEEFGWTDLEVSDCSYSLTVTEGDFLNTDSIEFMVTLYNGEEELNSVALRIEKTPGVCWFENGSLQGILPDGMTFDAARKTFTLKDCNATIDKTFIYLSYIDYITINIEGENTINFTGGDGTAFIDGCASHLTVCGDGILNLNFDGCSDARSIVGARITKIQDCTLNITSKNPEKTFYGYIAKSQQNYIFGCEYAALEVSNATINIDSQRNDSTSFANAGIDVSDSDLSIENSNISIKMTGGKTYGISAGYSDENGVYGGNVSVDDNSSIVMELDPAFYDLQVALSYYGGNISQKHMYAGDNATYSEKVTQDSFDQISDRYECTSLYFEISPHDWNVSIKPATTSADGTITRSCADCDEKTTATIPKIVSIKAGDPLTRTWTGTSEPIFMIIRTSDGNILHSWKTSYPKDFKSVGLHTFTVKNDTEYYSFSKQFTLKILPGYSYISSVTAGKSKLTVKMKYKVTTSTGGSTYQIAYKQKGTSKWKYTTTTSKSKVIKSLKKNKQYYVKVRAYKKVSGKTYYGAWSLTKLSKKVK